MMKPTEIRLPKITDEIYQEIGDFREYEMSQCIAYEFAIRDSITTLCIKFIKERSNMVINKIISKDTIDDINIRMAIREFCLSVNKDIFKKQHNTCMYIRFESVELGDYIIYYDERIDIEFYKIIIELDKFYVNRYVTKKPKNNKKVNKKSRDNKDIIVRCSVIEFFDKYYNKETGEFKKLDNTTILGRYLEHKEDALIAIEFLDKYNQGIEPKGYTIVHKTKFSDWFLSNPDFLSDTGTIKPKEILKYYHNHKSEYGNNDFVYDDSLKSKSKIYPNYKRPRLYTDNFVSSKVSVEMDFSRPQKELEAYIKSIVDDNYSIDNKSIKSPFELITDEVGEIAFDGKTTKSEIWKKMFFIYDYVEAKATAIKNIQDKKLSDLDKIYKPTTHVPPEYDTSYYLEQRNEIKQKYLYGRDSILKSIYPSQDEQKYIKDEVGINSKATAKDYYDNIKKIINNKSYKEF